MTTRMANKRIPRQRHRYHKSEHCERRQAERDIADEVIEVALLNGRLESDPNHDGYKLVVTYLGTDYWITIVPPSESTRLDGRGVIKSCGYQ